jgi:hypothetical protein
MNQNPRFTGNADPEIAGAFYCLLAEAILRAETIQREGIPLDALGALERACLRYAALLPKSALEMILRKADIDGAR